MDINWPSAQIHAYIKLPPKARMELPDFWKALSSFDVASGAGSKIVSCLSASTTRRLSMSAKSSCTCFAAVLIRNLVSYSHKYIYWRHSHTRKIYTQLWMITRCLLNLAGCRCTASKKRRSTYLMARCHRTIRRFFTCVPAHPVTTLCIQTRSVTLSIRTLDCVLQWHHAPVLSCTTP